MSTKFHSNPLMPVLVTTLSPTTTFAWKRSDWRRVFTTSKGAVTIEPHMPPRLEGEVESVSGWVGRERR